MATFLKSKTAAWASLAVIAILGAVIVIAAPEEQTLGKVIRIIYVHVAFSRAGAVGLYLSALMGLTLLITAREKFAHWTSLVGFSSLVLFAAGLAVSFVAQAMSWGGIAWREPRMATALNLLAVAAIVQVIESWLPWQRVKGALRVAFGVYQFVLYASVVNVLHPTDALDSSPSFAIRFTGYSLVILSMLLGAWLVWRLNSRTGTAGVIAEPLDVPAVGR